MSRPILTKKSIIYFVVAFVALSVIAGYYLGYGRIARKVSNELRGVALDWSDREKAYPDINIAELSATQKQIVALTKQEFLAQPSGTKFSEGVDENWCADFVSWIMKESGKPLSNPNSGSWRIPGTYTLQEYYMAEDRFRAADSGYTPTLGDVAIYRGSPVFGDHTNIVLSSDDGTLTTVGGNEGDRVRIYKNTKKDYQGLIGYGVLEDKSE